MRRHGRTLPPLVAKRSAITKLLDRAASDALSLVDRARTPDERPLTIALLGWARLSMQAREGGGYNLAVSELARELVRRGHRVIYLRSGMKYSIRPGIRIEPGESWQGIACFDVVNSPNLSTGNLNINNVRAQIASPALSATILDWMHAVDPDLVHIHVFEGFSFDLVRVLKGGASWRSSPLPVLVTPHNYFSLCPQVDLLHQEREVCTDYQGGRRCATCLHVPDHEGEKRRRATLQLARQIVGGGIYDAVKGVGKGVESLVRADRSARAESGGLVSAGLPQSVPDDPWDPAHERLARTREVHLTVVNDFGDRRKAGVGALNAADLVMAPGPYLKRVFEAMGVQPAKIKRVRLALPHFDSLRENARRAPGYDHTPWSPDEMRPLRLAYLGNCWANKGLHVLARAIPMLPEGVASRIELAIHASGDDRRFRAALAEFPQVKFHGAYKPSDLTSILASCDAGVFAGIALENSPLVILEMLHAGRFVVASRRGAIADFVRDGENGLFFAASDPADLARAICRVVRGEVVIPTPREVHERSPLWSFDEHVRETLDVYQRHAGRAHSVVEVKPISSEVQSF